MFIYRARGIQILSVACEVVGLTFVYWAWLFIRHEGEVTGLKLEFYVAYNAIIVAGVVLAAIRGGYQQVLSTDKAVWNVGAIRHMTYALTLLFIYLSISRDDVMSRTFLVGFIPLFYGVSFLDRKSVV